MKPRLPLASPGLLLLALLAVRTGRAAELAASAALLEPLTARPLGPANMGGRITAVAAVEGRPATLYAAAASGGVWKTVNNGITWNPVFERRASIGDVAVAPSNPDIVWVGTGEANARNSVSWGDGVWRSADGGKTWEHRGLRETHHIGRILIHPKNPDIVYVAALGHLWGPNKERGVFKTADGGKNWGQVLAPDADTGCIDLVLDPTDPETLYAAAYRVRRGPFSGGNPAVQFGPAAGLYRTRDGGKNWKRLTKGLPTRPLGRCGLDVYRKDPRILYAVVQTDQTNIKTMPGQAARSNDNPETGGVFCSRDRGESWAKVNDLCPRPFYYGQVRMDPRDERLVYVLGIHLHVSHDGGRTFKNDGAPGVHGDHHALWIDPADPEHLVLGNDGGVYFSHDRGTNWEHVRNLPIAQFYAAAVDLRKPYRIYGGLQDNGTWFGPSRTWNEEGITAADWQRMMGGDGFSCQADPADPDTIYAEGQYGRLCRLNLRTGSETEIRPVPPSPMVPAYRFNWNSPLLLSPHNPRTVYYGGNHVFRSVDRGDHWEVLGPDLTLGKPGPSADMGHTLTAIAESPVKAGVLWAGTDDGRVLITRNGGAEWINVSECVPGVPLERHVSRIDCSPTAAGTAWLALDRHRQDDRAPYLFRTDDYGLHWKPLHSNLPREGPVYVVRASPRNPDLLFAGTEFGLFVSLDGGDSWQPLGKGLPAVPVHDLVLHPRDRDLVIATHGRGLFVLDAAPLEEMTAAVRAEAAHLFAVKPATLYEPRYGRGLTGGKNYVTPNPPYGATIWYSLKEKTAAPVRVVIADAMGRSLAELQGSSEAGLHAVQWNLRGPAGLDPAPRGHLVGPGEYVARLYIAGQMMMARKFRVEPEE
jgi:photosystem II stability/assembly factor-like uncharacterized protein